MASGSEDYLIWALGEEQESQRKGLVGVVCWPSSKEAETPNNFAVVYSPREVSRHIHLSNRMFECTPIRISCMHLCLPDEPIYHMFKAGMTLSMGVIRSRLKFHVGKFSFEKVEENCCNRGIHDGKPWNSRNDFFLWVHLVSSKLLFFFCLQGIPWKFNTISTDMEFQWIKFPLQTLETSKPKISSNGLGFENISNP